MKKNRLLFVPFLIGLFLMLYSWFSCYPLSVYSANDQIFYHVSFLYWVSLPLLLGSMFLIALTFENKFLKWAMAVGFVLTLYSLQYFYYSLPGSDAHFFRGLTQYYINNHDLDPSLGLHYYFQWPSFFVLADMVTAISGISFSTYEFLIYTVIGVLLSTSIYFYVSRFNSKLAFIAVASYFLVLFYFLNYQAVPFSLAFVLLLLLFMLERQEKGKGMGISVVTLILFTSISVSHAFVSLFYIVYLFSRQFFGRSKWHFKLLVASVIIYLLTQVSLGRQMFFNRITQAFLFGSEYDSIASQTLTTVSLPLDAMAQYFSRSVTIVFGLICGIGFLLLLIKGKLVSVDKAVFLTGFLYSALGVVMYTLGSRAIPIAFIPVSFGAIYLLASRYGKYLKVILLFFLLFFVFVPVHLSLNSFPSQYQTREEKFADDFAVSNIDWTTIKPVIAGNGAKWYISTQNPNGLEVAASSTSTPLYDILLSCVCILYSLELEQDLIRNDLVVENVSQQIMDNYDILYSSGSNFMAVRSDLFSK